MTIGAYIPTMSRGVVTCNTDGRITTYLAVALGDGVLWRFQLDDKIYTTGSSPKCPTCDGSLFLEPSFRLEKLN